MPPITYGDGGRLKRLADEAAQAFLSTGADLNSTISKLATQHVLSEREVQRVVEAANHTVHAARRPDGGVVEFEMARVEKIASPRAKAAMFAVEKVAREKTASVAGADPEPVEDQPFKPTPRPVHHSSKHYAATGAVIGAAIGAGAGAMIGYGGRVAKGLGQDARRMRAISAAGVGMLAGGLAGGMIGSDVTDTVKHADDEDSTLVRSMAQHSRKQAEQAELLAEEARDKLAMADEGLASAALSLRRDLISMRRNEGMDLAEVMESLAEYPKLAASPEALLGVANLVKHVGRELYEPVTFTDRTMEILTNKTAREKVAEAVAPDMIAGGLHMSGMPVHVTNGEHLVWRDLDTLVDQYHVRAQSVRGIVETDDCVHFTRSRARTRHDAAVHLAGRPV